MENSKISAAPSEELGAMTMAQFCAAYNLTRVTFYRMEQVGDAPKTIRAGRKVLITRSAAREWETRMSGGVAKTRK